jgi:hypothetical protein
MIGRSAFGGFLVAVLLGCGPALAQEVDPPQVSLLTGHVVVAERCPVRVLNAPDAPFD